MTNTTTFSALKLLTQLGWSKRQRKTFLKLFLLAAPLLTLTLPVEAQTLPVRSNRAIEIRRVRGDVSYQNQQRLRPAKVGDRLRVPGDGVLTGNRSYTILAIDTDIGTAHVSEKTELRIKTLSVTANGGRVTVLLVSKGQARLQIRPFNNPESSFEIETPSGVAGVRGTDFGIGVEPTGKTNIATLEGTIAAIAQGETILVEKGFGSIIFPGEPPTPPRVFTNDVSIKRVSIVRTSLGTVLWKAEVDPFNLVWVNDQHVPVGKDGEIRATALLPLSRRARIRVQSPLGRERIYNVIIR